MVHDNELTEQESLSIITNMIQKAKATYHDKGISALLWGSVVTLASLITYVQEEYKFKIGFDIWLIVLFAIIPQIIIVARENKEVKVKRHDDEAIDVVWMVYGITIFGIVAYQNIIPYATPKIMHHYGYELTLHYIDNSKPDEHVKPFVPSIYSLYMLVYALPTLVTGLVKKFIPMTIGAIVCYAMFLLSCFTESKYDMLCGAVAAICCWLIPGIILRRRYLKSKASNV